MLQTGIEEVKLTSKRKVIADFFELMKPRVVLMVLMTTFIGFYLGSKETPDWIKLFYTLMGTALAAGGTLTLNQYMEREADARMRRTRLRPLPDGRIRPVEALVFGIATTLGGLLYLSFVVNGLSAIVTASITVSYLFLYTPLKQKTSLCSMVGAIPGALPPVIGWVAAQSKVSIEAWVLFAILFLWQIPHSLAIAWMYREDYALADMKLLPVISPNERSTGYQIINNCLALLTVSLLPTLIGFAGSLYFFSALILGILFLGQGVDLAISRSREAARRLLFASIIYLPLQLGILALDKT
jgi:protoheme IX farnesyltransferase